MVRTEALAKTLQPLCRCGRADLAWGNQPNSASAPFASLRLAAVPLKYNRARGTHHRCLVRQSLLTAGEKNSSGFEDEGDDR
jgi:hypothetical protein